MDVNQENYNISFFKPTTELAKKNARIAIWMISIWVVAIFGFQILLKVIEKPTPEPAFISFENVFENIKNENASSTDYKVFIKSVLSVTGKLSVSDKDVIVLNKAVSYAIFNMTNDEEKQLLTEKMLAFQSLKDVNISDENYLKLKLEFSETAASICNFDSNSIEAKLLPFAVKSFDDPGYDNGQLKAVMSKYLIHNQSFLTDTKFLGFPFHYFYTAVFLLILFIGLCLIFCIRTDKIYKELEIEERV